MLSTIQATSPPLGSTTNSTTQAELLTSRLIRQVEDGSFFDMAQTCQNYADPAPVTAATSTLIPGILAHHRQSPGV